MKKLIFAAALGAVAASVLFAAFVHFSGLIEKWDGSSDPERDEGRFYGLRDKTLQEMADGKLSREGGADRIEMAAELFRPRKLTKDLAPFSGTRRERIAQQIDKLLGPKPDGDLTLRDE